MLTWSRRDPGHKRCYRKTKFKEDVVKCNFLHLKGEVIFQCKRMIDGGGTDSKSRNHTFMGNTPILIL